MFEFGDLNKRMLLFQLVFGLADNKFKERLLLDNQITLTCATSDIRTAEMTKHQLLTRADSDKTVAVVARKPSRASSAALKPI